MISTKTSRILIIGLILTTIIPTVSVANAVPSRVARLGFITGNASFLPAGETKWVNATLNRPLITGDRIWAGTNSFLELQLDTATARLGNQTSLKLLNLTHKITQLQLGDGTLILKLWRLKPGQTVEVSTPNLAFLITNPGYYRISANNKENTSIVTVKQGRGKVYGTASAYQLKAGQSCRFGSNLKIYQCTAVPSADTFGRWSLARDQQMVKRISTRYVSSEMIGDEDLDIYGKWIVVKQYGHVWIPNEVASDWAPYRTGRWVWIRQWGWTWVDEQPWGFAPFHYGRWIYHANQWSWVPGPANTQPVYAPALVVFAGGRNFNLTLSTDEPGIAWFPLAPGEIYYPSYQTNRDYFINVNRSNMQVSRTYITNHYHQQNTQVNYQNITVVNAVTAVPAQTFMQSKPVNQAVVHVPQETIIQAPKSQIAAVVPGSTSVSGTSEPAKSQPSAEVLDKPSVVTTQPPLPPDPIAEEQKLLEKDPGASLTVQETEQLNPAKTEENTPLKLVDPQQTTVPVSNEPVDKSAPIQTPVIPEVQQPPKVQQLPEAQQPSAVQPTPEVLQPPEAQQPPAVQSTPEVLQPPEAQQPPEESQ